MLIPSKTLKEYGISQKAIIIGQFDHFEIWDLAKYNEYELENSKKFEDVADQLVNKNER